MACQSVYTWSFTGLVTAFLDLYIAFFLLCASAAAFWASKFLGVLGLSLPCPCEGFFGLYFNKNLCFKKLFIEYPLEKISYVQLSVMSRFPFNDIVLIRHPNCDLNLRSIRDEERKVIELDGDGASCSEVSITRKPSNNFSFNEELGAKNEVSKGAVKELGTNKERFDIKGKGILHHRQSSTGFRRRRKSSFDLVKYPSVGSYDSVLSSVQEYPRFPCSIGLTDVRNNDVCTEKDVNGKLVYDNCDKNTIKRLEKALEEQHASYCALYLELEKERSASASATEEAMAMIQRLQEEKASIEIEARQYQRILEEKSAYDAEEMSILEEILIHRERENHFLEKELESYREIMSSVGPKLSDFSIDSNDASMEKKEDINNTTGSEKEHDNVITEPHGVLDPSLSEEEEPYSHDVHVTTQQSNSIDKVSTSKNTWIPSSSGLPPRIVKGRSLRDSMSIIEDERQINDGEIGWLREKLKIVKEGREKLHLSTELGEMGWRKLNLLEDIAYELQEIRQLTELGKATRQGSLPLPTSKAISRKRRCRSVSSGQHMSV